ncbi:phospholipase D-like domain-containing protein [Streptomyces erythrochromogenes]|uniref:phospholipase D-like domain-containing protein n=1 Tax=Streptomyces erythrochromogenes TaxID=285574 RepID=UPI003808D70C
MTIDRTTHMHISAIKRLAAASALAVTASLLGVSQATAADPAPVTPKAVFNDPVASPTAIRDELIKLIRNTEKNGLIRGSIFLFTDHDVAAALEKASRENSVKVQILFDNRAKADQVLKDGVPENTGSEYSWLRGKFAQKVEEGTAVDADAVGSFAYACPEKRGCIGNRVMEQADGDVEYAINHNKYFTFSKVGASEKVVFQASANLTAGHLNRMYNNAVVVPNATLYDGYSAYWKDQLREGTTGTGAPDYYKTPSAGIYKAYFFPRIESDGKIDPKSTVDPRKDPSTDTIVNVLEKVDCAAAPARIRIGMYAFTRTQVADRLRTMSNEGCDVQMVLNGDSGSVGTGVRDILATAPKIKVNVCEGVDGSKTTLGIHSKYMTIDGVYLGERSQWVFTGSHNYTYPNLRSQDETLLKIQNPEIYEGFRKNFDETLLRSAACSRPLAVPFQ